jgi:hypothetical protein
MAWPCALHTEGSKRGGLDATEALLLLPPPNDDERKLTVQDRTAIACVWLAAAATYWFWWWLGDSASGLNGLLLRDALPNDDELFGEEAVVAAANSCR